MKFTLRQIARSLARQFFRYVPALAALAVAAACVCALGSLSADVGRKMTREFRERGANAVARPASGTLLSPSQLSALARAPGVASALPVRVADARARGHRVVAVGLDFSRARAFASAWDRQGALPASSREALVGSRLASRLDVRPGSELPVTIEGRPQTIRISGLVSTGEGEDDEILLPDGALPADLRAGASAMLLRVAGGPREVEARARALEASTGARVDTILAVARSEGRVVERLRSLLFALAAAVALLAGFGTATMLLASVTQRRREIGLAKSLGSGTRRLLLQFAGEAVALGLSGGVLGAAAGTLAAAAIERRLFSATLDASPGWIAASVGVAAFVAAASAMPAVARVARTEPIVALREE